jgi:predicted secreted hydrolase
VRQIPAIASPMLVDWPRDEAAHEGLPWEIWWITATLAAGTRRFAAQVILMHLAGGYVSASVTLTDLETALERCATEVAEPGQSALRMDLLEVQTDAARFSGSFEDGYQLRARVDDQLGFELDLQPTVPVLFNGGAGEFRFAASRTTQYSVGALAVTGTVRVDGAALSATGNGWYDRQWAHGGDLADSFSTFSWFGLCLSSGVVVSLWDTSMRSEGGHTWATVVRPDGTHIVASAEPVADHAGETFEAGHGRIVPRTWRLSIPALGAELEVSQRTVHNLAEFFFYTGALDVSGVFEGAPVAGYGYCDLVGWP